MSNPVITKEKREKETGREERGEREEREERQKGKGRDNFIEMLIDVDVCTFKYSSKLWIVTGISLPFG